jgi:predicted aspartyl protease
MNALIPTIILLFCSILVAPACAREGMQKKEEHSNPSGQESVKKIPIEVPITNQIYLQAGINNSAPMWFLLDTGSTWTFLDADKTKELDIATEGSRTVETGEVHPIRMTFARGTTLEVSGLKIPIAQLAVMPLKFTHAPQIVGIIGSDLFKRFVVEIDYVAKTLVLFEQMNYKGHGQILPMEILEEIPHVVVYISKSNVRSKPAKLLVDTGAAQTIVLYAPFVEKHKLLETTAGTTQIAAGGLGGGSVMRKVRAKSVTIGDTAIDNPLIYFSPNRRSAEWRDGILGNGFLNRFKMTVDYSRRQIILEPSELINIPTDFDSFQIDIVPEGKQFKVKDVYQPAIGGIPGLKPGDILLAVNGKETSNLTLIQIKGMFKLDGGEIVLLVKRGEKTVPIKVKTLPIF